MKKFLTVFAVTLINAWAAQAVAEPFNERGAEPFGGEAVSSAPRQGVSARHEAFVERGEVRIAAPRRTVDKDTRVTVRFETHKEKTKV